MASLQDRLSDLITAIGADIKALQSAVGGTPDKHNAWGLAQSISGNAHTYLSGSDIAIPNGKLKLGTVYTIKFNVVKTAAGTAAPAIAIRIGSAGTTADSIRSTLTFASQTAVIDEGVFEIDVVFRATGTLSTIQSLGRLIHRLVTTGLNNTAVNTVVLNTSGTFDTTPSNQIIGVSINPGASAAWTVTVVTASLVNLA